MNAIAVDTETGGLRPWPGQRTAQHGALQDAQIALHGFLWMTGLEKKEGRP